MIKFRALSYSSDLYAAGKTLYTMLTGKLPKINKSVKSLIEKFRTKKSHDRILHILQKSTNQDPDLRYNSAEELKQELTAVLNTYFRKKHITIVEKKQTVLRAATRAAVVIITIGVAGSGYYLTNNTSIPNESAEFFNARDQELKCSHYPLIRMHRLRPIFMIYPSAFLVAIGIHCFWEL